MAKQRASLPLPRLASSDFSEVCSSSAESNIQVGGARKTRSASVSSSASHNSTPPTSLPEESISDAASEKLAMDTHQAASREKGDDTSRRSSRRRSGPSTYNVAALAGVSRVPSVEALKAKENRSFSGQTLVNDSQAASADTPRRELLEQGVKSLDMDWDINDTEGAATSSKQQPTKAKRRSSLLDMDKVMGFAGKVGKAAKKVLGKRSREEAEPESSKDAGRRQSRRISSLPLAKAQSQDQDDDAVERPSKMARVASSFSMPSLSSALNLSKTQPRERPVKKYQKQGLYVGQNPGDYKPEVKMVKKRLSSARPGSAASEPTARAAVMPLPTFGYLDRERPFVIPFGIFAPQWRERGSEKPKDWGKINKNRFVGDAKDEWRNIKLPNSTCECRSECADNCWNRAMGVECDNNNCNAGPDCSNRDFTELSARMARANKYDKKSLTYLYNAGVEVIKTKDRGFGVRACREFEPNEIITEYTGEIITQNEAYRRVIEEYTGKTDYYQMEFDQGMILDATRGSLTRFVNHSCDPNCEMVKRTVGGQPRMALFAGENGIMTGEELTYDYNFDPYSTTNVQKCLCGASNCRQILGPKPAGEKKPSSKKEKLDMATNLKKVASGASKRKVNELFDDDLTPIEIPKELVKKRKVPQMSKGWVYVDEEWERLRQEEAMKDKELQRLQREGVVAADLAIKRPKYPGRGAKMVEKVKASVTFSKSKSSKKDKDEDEPKLNKPSMLSRVSGSIRRPGSSASTSASEKRKSTLSTASASLRQSTITFQPRNISGASGEALLGRVAFNTSATDKSAKRNSYMSRTSSKRNSTVRVVTEDDQVDEP